MELWLAIFGDTTEICSAYYQAIALALAAIFVALGVFVVMNYFDRKRYQATGLGGSELEAKLKELRIFNRELEENTRNLRAKEIELSSANKQLADLEKAKSKFVTVTTHQLRTPLSAIKWTFEMFDKGTLGQLSDEQKDFISKGFQSTERVIKIVNDLLNIDLIETEKDEYNFHSYQLADMVDNVAYEFSNQAASRKTKIIVAKPTRPLPEIEIDQSKVRMVLENVIDNAIKYSRLGAPIVVTIDDNRLNSITPSIEVSVKDEGIGIPKDQSGKIFSKFFRGSNAAVLEPGGTGVGLYIGKDIIEKHGGAIWFESEEGKGSVFHLTLPLKHKKL
jgi:signal transduction histidine kinase